MATLAPSTHRPQQPRRQRTQLQRLLQRRDDLADRLVAHRSHGLPTTDAWIALVRLEDHIRETHPRAYTTHLPSWLQRQAPGAHPLGRHDPACPLCTTSTALRGAAKWEER